MKNSEQPINTYSEWNGCEDVIRKGLTKREYFAGLAMQGLCSNNEWSKNLTTDDWDSYKERLISGSVELADELLKQLDL